MTRNLLELDAIGVTDLAAIVALAERGGTPRILDGKSAALVFEKPSARTRNATEMAVHDLGGYAVVIYDAEVGIDSREPAEDVARTLGAFHDLICVRVRDHGVLGRMAAALASEGLAVPIVNLLSDLAHPCQALADLLTLRELAGLQGSPLDSLAGSTVAWVGDANNVAASLAHVCLMAGISLRVASPSGFQFSPEQLSAFGSRASELGSLASVVQLADPREAVQGVEAVATDVWTSMGQEDEREARLAAFGGYTVTEELMDEAGDRTSFLHCLPAHRGEEVTAGVLEGSRSAVWRQVAHRHTAMLGVFSWLGGDAS